MTTLSIRRLLPSDSIEELTALLQRAFAPMGEQGLNCTCVDQSVEMTQQRARLGDCFVAVVDGRLAGTITLHASDGGSAIRLYRDPKVASLHQFGVAPARQRAGIGRALLQTAEAWAKGRRYRQLALDTPAPAEPLRDYYARCGFRLADVVQLEGKTYPSVVLSKVIACSAVRPGPGVWPARHPAEWAMLHRVASH